MDFFKGIGNFFGGLFGGNKDDDERRRRQQQAQPKPQSQPQPAPTQGNGQGAGNWLDASPLTAQPFKPQNNMPIQQGQQNSLVSLVQNKPQPPKPTQPQPQLPPKPQPQPQLNKGVLDMEQSFKIKNNAPKPQPLTNITNSIPNYNVMSPEKQRQAIADVYDPPEARLARLSKKVEDDRKMRDGVKNFAEFIGNVPVVNTGANLSTWLASAAGELTGNKSLRDTADNTRNMINLGMTNQELNALPKGQRDKLSTVGNVASALSPLDVWGATSIAKAPIIGGVKQAAKEGIMSEAGKNILKQTAKETGKQYGTQIAIGAGAGGAIDPAIQAYVNDGKVDWSSVPNSMLQGGLWAAVLPEFSSKSRLTKSLHSRGSLVHEVEPNAPAIQENSPITPAGENPAQKPSGISTPNRPEGMNKAQNFPAKTEPQPVVTQPVPRPEPQPVQPQPVQPRPEPAYQTPPQTLQDAINDINDINDPLAPQRPVEPVQAPESPLQPIQRQLDEQMLEPPRQEVVTPPQVVDTPAQVQARQVQELNATQPRLTPEQVADINAQKALADAPTEAMIQEARRYKSADGKAMSVEDELTSRLSRRLIPGISPSREYNNAIRDAFQELPDDYQRWVEKFSHRMRSTSEREEAVLHPERYQDLFEQETRRTPSLTPVKPELATPKQEVPATKPRTHQDIVDEVDTLDESNPANAKRLQELSDEFDKLDEAQPAPKAAKTSEPVTEPTNVVESPQPTKTSTPPSDDGELGKVARQAVLDGSITTKEGQAEVIRKTTALANKEAEQAGTTIEDIIRKGQEAWEKSQLAKHDLSPEEVANGAKTPEGKAISPVDGFTPEQQSIYKRYSQELSTVRDRTEVALKEGNQGEWYAPRQYLDDMGNSPEYNPDLINEMKRNTTAKTNSEGNPLDYSTRQHEDYLRRYMDAENAGTQRLVNAVESNADTGEATGVKLSDKAKANVSEGMEKVIAKRDEGLKLQAEGDAKGAMKAQREVQREIDRTFKQLIRDVPAGPGRKEAVNQLKVLRGTYMQSTVQTFALSNIVNRVADQGARVLLGAQRPVTRLLEKAIAPMMDKKVMDGVEALTLNTSKNARKAAKEMTKGTLSNEIRDNFKANTALAGEGRNPLVKAMAKIDAYVRASGTSVTQSGDISTQVARRTLELGASRPEAKGLKTVDEYKRYFADYMNGKNFKADLASAEADLMPRIGLAGSEGDNMAHGGKFSKGVSKYLDNGVKTGVEALGQRFGVKGLGDKRIVQEVNDYWKVNGPGYAAVTSRVFGYVSNSLAGGVPKVLKAVKEAGKGDPAASARATQIAAQSISDAVAVYGTIGAAFILPKIAEGVIGFTGAQPTSGSSDSAHNKSEQVPANQWYLNLPGGDRLYIDPSRIGAPGVGANLAGGLQKGTAGDTAANTLGQMANQVGGESLPEKYNTFTTAFADTTASESEREYARKRLGSMAVPAMGLSNNIANWMDDKKRDTAGFINTLKSRIPGLRQSVPVATDARGNEITNTKQVSGGSSLLSIGKNTESKEYKASDPVGAEIARLQRGDQDVFPTNANKNAKNKNTQDLARLLINDDVYKKADDKKKGEMMSSVLNGTDFKDVNTSISNEDKLAIMHAKQQGDKKKKWLENNDNAANYYRADYNNAKANNTLTDKDESLNEKSGKKYKMISAQVDRDFGADQELKRLYSAIGKSEIKNYFNHNSDMYDPELGERLLAFDQARTAKGVSRNSKFSDKPKYSSTTAKGGSGRRGGRSGGRSGSGSGSGGKARGYNMPTSLLSSKSNSAPDIKRGERLFKAPTPVSTAEKTKSRIPNISVKKGIHL